MEQPLCKNCGKRHPLGQCAGLDAPAARPDNPLVIPAILRANADTIAKARAKTIEGGKAKSRTEHDRKTYLREYMRNRRAKERAAKDKGGRRGT